MASGMFDFQKIKEKLLSPKGSKILLAVGLAGIVLIAVSSFIPASSSGASGTAAAAAVSGSAGMDEYAAELESQLKTIISSISGAGNAEIMVTFSESAQVVYEQQQKKSTNKSTQTDSGGENKVEESASSEQETVVISTGSGEEALVTTEIMPQVKGVVVVCDGGDDAAVQETIIQAVSTALDLPTNHICVTKKSAG